MILALPRKTDKPKVLDVGAPVAKARQTSRGAHLEPALRGCWENAELGLFFLIHAKGSNKLYVLCSVCGGLCPMQAATVECKRGLAAVVPHPCPHSL